MASLASEFMNGFFLLSVKCVSMMACVFTFILRLLQVDVCTVVCCSDGSEIVNLRLFFGKEAFRVWLKSVSLIIQPTSGMYGPILLMEEIRLTS